MNIELINIKKKALGLTSQRLSELSNVPIGTLNKILCGSTKNPQIDTLAALCNVLGCSVSDILTDTASGDAQMLSDDFDLSGYLPKNNSRGGDLNNNAQKNSRRFLTLVYADPYSDEIETHDMLADSAPCDCDFAVRVCDSSMEPLIQNGNICYVKKAKNITVGNLGVFKIDGKIYVRKLEKERISALNPNYPSFSINDYEEFAGIVIDFGEY